ncbi:unnamed protein product [Phytophthora lilii]|uniref:Unnamed protein product n=1 Tax=Phytophthora lilii TaxID=2077276 RepID=A0A9W6TNV5_9STRA|nr:unnamed protein product [Phytophthora lilii]
MGQSTRRFDITVVIVLFQAFFDLRHLPSGTARIIHRDSEPVDFKIQTEGMARDSEQYPNITCSSDDCDDAELSTSLRPRATTNGDDINDVGGMEMSSPVNVSRGIGPASAAGQRATSSWDFFRCDEELVKLMKKKVPPKSRRFSISFWAPSASNSSDGLYCDNQNEPDTEVSQGDQPELVRERQERTAALRLVWILLNNICSTLCGSDAAPEFLELFLSWINPPHNCNAGQDYNSCSCFYSYKEGSVEQRYRVNDIYYDLPLPQSVTSGNRFDVTGTRAVHDEEFEVLIAAPRSRVHENSLVVDEFGSQSLSVDASEGNIQRRLRFHTCIDDGGCQSNVREESVDEAECYEECDAATSDVDVISERSDESSDEIAACVESGELVMPGEAVGHMLTIYLSATCADSIRGVNPTQPGGYTVQNTATSSPVLDTITIGEASVLNSVQEREITVQDEEMIDAVDVFRAASSSDAGKMFRQGEENQSRKMGPARMLEALVAMYPHRYNLPGENEIRGLIALLMKRRQKTTYVPAEQLQTETIVHSGAIAQIASHNTHHQQEPTVLSELVLPHHTATTQSTSSVNHQQQATSAPTEQRQVKNAVDPAASMHTATPENYRQRAVSVPTQQLEPAYVEYLTRLVAENPQIQPKCAMIIFYERCPGSRDSTAEKQIREMVSVLKKKIKEASN